MAKRAANTNLKLFNLDLESLLISENSQEDENEAQTSNIESPTEPKKFKSKDVEKMKEAADNGRPEVNRKRNFDKSNRPEDASDVTTFFENVGNDFNKSMQVRKFRLGQFTEEVVSMHQSKIADLIKKQEAEIEIFKEQAINEIQEGLNKFEGDLKKLKLQEAKLIKILETQIKLIQKTGEAEEQWTETFANIHQRFFQEYEKLRSKHKNEVLDLTKTLSSEMSSLQDKFIAESKKEEMQTMKKYLSTCYF